MENCWVCKEPILADEFSCSVNVAPDAASGGTMKPHHTACYKAPGPCVICGARSYGVSFGGPSICPSCDCGHFGHSVVKRQGDRIKELEAQLAARTEALPIEPTHDMLKALGGDPVILAASDEDELRERYKAMLAVSPLLPQEKP